MHNCCRQDGWLYGGVKYYKYTLDEGKTWAVLEYGNTEKVTQFDGLSVSIFKAAAPIDIELGIYAGTDGDFA